MDHFTTNVKRSAAFIALSLVAGAAASPFTLTGVL